MNVDSNLFADGGRRLKARAFAAAGAEGERGSR
jgi:hypothetical protein